MDPLKVSGHYYNRPLPTSRIQQNSNNDMKRAVDRKAKVKVSTLLSPESQKAILMAKEDTARQRRLTQEKLRTAAAPAPPRLPPLPLTTTEGDVHDCNDNVGEPENVGFGALLNKISTTRLHGDITDKNYTPRQAKKRALRFGDRLHNAMEVVEIVVYGSDNNNDKNNNSNNNNNNTSKSDEEGEDGSDDEEEAKQRAADVSSHERCQAWLELHFDTDDASSQSSTER